MGAIWRRRMISRASGLRAGRRRGRAEKGLIVPEGRVFSIGRISGKFVEKEQERFVVREKSRRDTRRLPTERNRAFAEGVRVVEVVAKRFPRTGRRERFVVKRRRRLPCSVKYFAPFGVERRAG